MSSPATGAPARPGTAGTASGPVPHRWLIMVFIAVAQLMVVLDATIVNIALPTAQRDLGFSDADRQWVVTAYSLAFGSLLLLGGRVADLFGRKNAFLIGLVGFALASALGGAAGSFEVLIVARAVQGLFGALLAPAALSLLTTTFTDPAERGRAFGIFGAVAGSGAALGLLLGGILTEHLNWRWTLYVNIAFAAIAFVGGLLLLRRTARDRTKKLDVPGTLLASAGLFCLVYGFANAETHTWSSVSTWGFLVASALLLAAFCFWQTRTAHPLLPLRILLHRDRGAAYAAMLVAGASIFGISLFLTYYLQQVLGLSPVRTGLAFLPMSGAIMVTATTGASVLLPRFGPKLVVSVGMLLGGIGALWLSRLDVDSSYAGHVLPPLVIAGLGMGAVMATAMSQATAGVAHSDAGAAGALVNTMQQVGGSLGTALLNTIVASGAADYLAAHDARAPKARLAAGVHGYSDAYVWTAVFFAVGLVAAGLLFRRRRAHRAEQHAAPVVHM
ncbi:MFS transporter [Streptomyces sp. AM 3-1-1]|uniref:MFS transporter n=1 Tax=Streptomyces sp. AM 3-1-1 TaxID=3028711 RepID=UPI0023B89C01|nr:MFS transporter [Streptomyces sp. AM 3-1-1]WEH30775.1 MFS transporter [Streptomyces sp. AM 3-1-1]